MNKQLLLSEFLTTPWALMPERLQAMSGILTRWSAGEPPSDETLFQVNTDRVLRDTRKQMAAAPASRCRQTSGHWYITLTAWWFVRAWRVVTLQRS
jgi:hypothetical protein